MPTSAADRTAASITDSNPPLEGGATAFGVGRKQHRAWAQGPVSTATTRRVKTEGSVAPNVRELFRMNLKSYMLVLGGMLIVLPAAAAAQVGSTTDILMGKISGADSQAVAGGRGEVTSAETGITRTKTTGTDGRYTIVFPDGGGTYRITVRAIGMAPVTRDIQRQGDEDRLIADFTMGRTATQLATVQVRATPRRGDPNQRPEPGNTERSLNPNLINRLPVDAGDLTALAALAPGVVQVPGTDTTKASFNVAGQPSNQNSITLDGLSFGAGTVPAEAVRNTRVVTSTYDVARGQFTGGQVASTTRGGTNNIQGAVGYSLRDQDLEFVGDTNPTFGQKYTQNQINLGAGGPIIRDKLFTFGALTFTRRTDPLLSLLAADPLTLQRLGTNPDSVNRFVSLVQQY